MIEQKNNNLYLRDLTARTKSSAYSVALSAVRFAAEPIRIGSPCRRSTAKRSTHLAQVIDPEEEEEEESQSQVLSTFTAEVSRCVLRLNEFTHEQAAPTCLCRFLKSTRRGSICTSFASDRVAPSFLARAAAYTHVQHARVRRILRWVSLEKSSSSELVVDNPLRRMRRMNERCATASIGLYVVDL